MDELEKTVRKHVLKNTYDFGKADAGSVTGKVIAESPDAKKDMKKTAVVTIATSHEDSKKP